MKLPMNGTERIQAAPATVRRFVTDPEQVGRCLPDLQELQVTDPRHFIAHVKIGLGPVRGRFKLEVELNPDAGPDKLELRLKGSGMGSGLNMSSQVRVCAADDTTEMQWTAEASVSGPLASVGGRLLEAQARKTTEQLFANIRRTLEQGEQAAAR